MSKTYVKALINESLGKKLGSNTDRIMDEINGLDTKVSAIEAKNDELEANLELMSNKIDTLDRYANAEEQMHRPNILGFVVFLLSILVVALFLMIITFPEVQTTLILVTGFLLGFIVSNVLTEKVMLPMWHHGKSKGIAAKDPTAKPQQEG